LIAIVIASTVLLATSRLIFGIFQLEERVTGDLDKIKELKYTLDKFDRDFNLLLPSQPPVITDNSIELSIIRNENDNYIIEKIYYSFLKDNDDNFFLKRKDNRFETDLISKIDNYIITEKKENETIKSVNIIFSVDGQEFNRSFYYYLYDEK
jgi:hypothetical protein